MDEEEYRQWKGTSGEFWRVLKVSGRFWKPDLHYNPLSWVLCDENPEDLGVSPKLRWQGLASSCLGAHTGSLNCCCLWAELLDTEH